MILVGFLKTIGLFFSLPIVFIKSTFVFLEKVGREGFRQASGDESIPFMMVSGYESDAGDFVLGLILGAVIAFFWIWIAAVWLEILSLGVVLVNNTKEIIKNTTPKESA